MNVCKICDYKAFEKTELRIHILSVHAETMYPCSVCDLDLGRKSNHCKHIKVAQSEEDISCQECGYRNKSKDPTQKKKMLARHKAVHHGTKKICGICNQVYLHLAIHQRTIHGGQKFNCDVIFKQCREVVLINTNKSVTWVKSSFVQNVITRQVTGNV